MSPGAMYPYVPATAVQIEDPGFKNLAVPKSETRASNSEFNKTFLLDILCLIIGGMHMMHVIQCISHPFNNIHPLEPI